MIVLDASAWVRALVDSGPIGDAAREEMVDDPAWVAPAHSALEVLRTIRRYELAGMLIADQADDLAAAVADAEVTYVGAESWVLRAGWESRHNVSAYDAPYVVLARAYDAPVLTCDRRLAKAVVDLGLVAKVLG